MITCKIKPTEITTNGIKANANILLTRFTGVINLQKYERGDSVTITAIFKDNDGNLITPTSPTYDVRKPDKSYLVSPSAIGAIGTGTYKADVDMALTAELGTYVVRVYGMYNGHRILNSDHFTVVDVI